MDAIWENVKWAEGHLKRRHPDVSVQEAWEAAFLSPVAFRVDSPDQLRFPPWRRFWTIGFTLRGRRLLVVWEQWRGHKNLITSYEPSAEQRSVYEKKPSLKEKGRRREKSTDRSLEWESQAALWSDTQSAMIEMQKSISLSMAEKRKLFGSGKTKPISVRLPEEDLDTVKRIAEIHQRPYQQLLVLAIQQYIDRVFALHSKNSKV